MRIIHYMNHGRRANGHVEMAVDLACEQARQNHEVHFASGPCDFTDILAANGVIFHLLPEASGSVRPVKMAASFLPVCLRVRPNVVNAHMVAAALAAAIIRPIAGFRLVTTVHNSFDRQSFAMRVGDRVIAVSEAVRAEMGRKWVPLRKLRVVKNGTIGGSRRPLHPAKLRELHHPSIVTVAGLHPRKGIGDLLIAFDRVYAEQPSAHLYLVGDGPYRETYEQQARGLPSGNNVHFMGHQDDPREILGSADIFVLASLQEPFALVLCEARQMGCAIIATAVGGSPESLWYGKKGILVPPSAPTELGEAILDLLRNDEKRRQFAQAAADNLDDIQVERMARDTLSIYDEMLGVTN